jgi:hypothetical protein
VEEVVEEEVEDIMGDEVMVMVEDIMVEDIMVMEEVLIEYQ